jgi:sulfonate transport system permease protein
MAGDVMAGLDALELAGGAGSRRLRGARGFAVAARSALWPRLLALAIAVGGWQLVVWAGWRPEYVLPGPVAVLAELWRLAGTGDFWIAVATTLRRALTGFALAGVIGFVLGVAVARSRPLRAALGSMITAMQTMPSIAWFPLAILLFQLTESAIAFVVVLGAAPSVANGVLAGVDYVPPLLLRAGRNLGARGLTLYRYVIAPASLPAVVAGLKQGWAFAWRSLMAGELLVIIANRPSLGARLDFARQFSDAPGLLAYMVVILLLGLLVDAAFGSADRGIRRVFGITDRH